MKESQTQTLLSLSWLTMVFRCICNTRLVQSHCRLSRHPLWEVALLGGLGLGALDHESQQYHNLPGQYLFDTINFLLKGGLPLFLLRKLLYPAVIT
jgi:hypothetical protein